MKKILVPVDGSPFAECALPMALALAKRTGAELRLAMVSQPADLPVGVWADTFLANHVRYLDSITESFAYRVGPQSSVSSVLLEGDVASALCAEAKSSGADLVVMSTHGHGGLTRMWLGSVADEVLRESPVPVLLVRPNEDDAGEPVAPDGLHHVVVPLDGTPFGEAAISPALAIGKLFGARLTLLRTIPFPVMVSSYFPDTAGSNVLFIQQATEEAQAYLTALRARIDDGSTEIEAKVLVSGHPSRGVLDHIAASGADFVAMTSHNRHGLARVALGSIADKIVRGASTPVLVVRPGEGEPAAAFQEAS